jgi:hypothetical protein
VCVCVCVCVCVASVIVPVNSNLPLVATDFRALCQISDKLEYQWTNVLVHGTAGTGDRQGSQQNELNVYGDCRAETGVNRMVRCASLSYGTGQGLVFCF